MLDRRGHTLCNLCMALGQSKGHCDNLTKGDVASSSKFTTGVNLKIVAVKSRLPFKDEISKKSSVQPFNVQPR